ncbi:hypothetical protein SISNIDRAFT_459197, partial [Sistotremastrum niveocremeum HHB9708]
MSGFIDINTIPTGNYNIKNILTTDYVISTGSIGDDVTLTTTAGPGQKWRVTRIAGDNYTFQPIKANGTTDTTIWLAVGTQKNAELVGTYTEVTISGTGATEPGGSFNGRLLPVFKTQYLGVKVQAGGNVTSSGPSDGTNSQVWTFI